MYVFGKILLKGPILQSFPIDALSTFDVSIIVLFPIEEEIIVEFGPIVQFSPIIVSPWIFVPG